MQHKSFGNMQCPIARSLERVGEWWSILILRDAFKGATRFEQFQKGLDIAPNMLTRRLNALVESGLLERRRYSEHPPRDEYLLTGRGRDFRPVLWALLAYGNRHFAPEGPNVVIVDGETGELAEPILVDRHSGRPLTEPPFRSVYGPAAAEAVRRRHAASGLSQRPHTGLPNAASRDAASPDATLPDAASPDAAASAAASDTASAGEAHV